MNFDEKLFVSVAEKAGLDLPKWEIDRHSNAVKKMLVEDLRVAYNIGINATPSVFINGRRVNDPQESALDFLIESLLKK
jgi:predicted DsbA family dithiol-disulfide isomerase